MKKILYSVVLSFLFLSCATSPSRHLQPAGGVGISISLGGAVVDQIQGYSFLPIPANLAIGVTYGINDDLTAGMNIYPVALLGRTLILEPLGVYNILDQDDNVPALNTALSVPVTISFAGEGVVFYPTLSLTPVYANKTGSVYTSLECIFDTSVPKISWGWKLGGEWYTWDEVLLTGELGLIYIGEKSTVSPLSRAGIGIPVFAFGTTIDLIN